MPTSQSRSRKQTPVLTCTLLIAILLVAAACAQREPASDPEEEVAGSEAPEENDVDLKGSGRHCPPGVRTFHADYRIEPTFDTPEEAVKDANETHPQIGSPEDIDQYEIVERSDGWLDFEYIKDGDLHHRWEVVRDFDDRDRWGMAALDYCGPEDPFRRVKSTRGHTNDVFDDNCPMNVLDLANWRMNNLLLNGNPLDSPESVLRWLGAVQAQEFGPAKWSVAHRTSGFDDVAMEQACNEGRILRTHTLRPTWHFVLPEDIRLIQQVTGPRVLVSNGHMCRRLELDDLTLDRCVELISEALAGGDHLTRKEIGEMLAGQGIEAKGQRLAYIMMHAELTAIVCSGALKGKQHTYALIEERAPNARRYDDPDEALAEFTRRYFASHGPATINDFKNWGSLRVADIKRGISMIEPELESFEFDGLTLWFVHGPPDTQPSHPHALLLQGYDEYFMGYLESRYVVDAVRRLATLHPDEMIANGSLVLDTQLAGHWKRTLTATSVAFEILHYEPLDDAKVDAIQREVDRFGAFLGREASVELKRI